VGVDMVVYARASYFADVYAQIKTAGIKDLP
jgi:hypothetical protein